MGKKGRKSDATEILLTESDNHNKHHLPEVQILEARLGSRLKVAKKILGEERQ